MYPFPMPLGRFPSAFGANGIDFIGRKVASASLFIDFNWTKAYDQVIFQFDGVRPAADDVSMFALFSDDFGVSFLQGASAYRSTAQMIFTTIAQFTDADNIILNPRVSGNGRGNVSGELGCGQIVLHRPYDANASTFLQGSGAYTNAAGKFAANIFQGRRSSAGVTNGIEFSMNTGNIAEGEFTAWGILKK